MARVHRAATAGGVLAALVAIGCGGEAPPPEADAPLFTDAPLAAGSTEPVAAPADGILRASKAGTNWYPGSAAACAAEVDGLLAAAPTPPPLPGVPVALIVPHAGWRFSGPVAAAAFRAVRDLPIETVILVGVCHHAGRVGFRGCAVWSAGAMESPLGLVPVDVEAATELRQAAPGPGEMAAAFAGEHSLELVLPFIQRCWPEARVVPVLVNGAASEDWFQTARAIEAAVHAVDRRVLLVASTDLAHGAARAETEAVDRETVAAFGTLDARIVDWKADEIRRRKVPGLTTALCGLDPVVTTLWAARRLGADAFTTCAVATSADSPHGKPEGVVGYVSGVLTRGVLDLDAQHYLVGLARDAVRAAALETPAPVPLEPPPALAALPPRGVFVTLKRDGALRGCVGRVASPLPLPQLVIETATGAWSRDPRFAERPKLFEELRALAYKVAVLGPPEPMRDAADFVLGVHGVRLSRGEAHAVFLPEVAPEAGYDRETFLTRLAEKAGLPPGAWRSAGTRLERFTVFAFSG